MKLIRLTGGLGNQMFIYAFYLFMRRHFSDIKLDLSEILSYKLHNGYELERVFRVMPDRFCITKVAKKIWVFFFFKRIKEYCEDVFRPERYLNPPHWPLIYYSGYFQSEKFFEEVAEEVKRTFVFDERKLNVATVTCLEQIRQAKESVSVHIRRGDYLSEKNRLMYGDICTESYYRKALERLSEKVKNPEFFIFSDDPDWCRTHLNFTNATYVDWNKGEDSWQDMYLISQCRNNIIANSSFSWWGAWLNTNPDKLVIAPSCWFNTKKTPNIHPVGWIRI